MYHKNSGRFIHKIVLKKPSAQVRDELGGIMTKTYDDFLTVFALCETRNQSRQQVMGDFVTLDTRYFVVRDITTIAPDINTKWQLEYNGFTYIINQLELLDERNRYIQITATAVNGGGGII